MKIIRVCFYSLVVISVIVLTILITLDTALKISCEDCHCEELEYLTFECVNYFINK